MIFILRLASLLMALICAAATGINTILANLTSIASLAAKTQAATFSMSKKGLILCLVSIALSMVLIMKLPKKHKGVDSHGRIKSINPRRILESPSVTRKNHLKKKAEPLNLGLTISRASSPAPSEPRSIRSSVTITEQQQHTEHSVVTTESAPIKPNEPKDCDTYELVRGTESQELKGILVYDSLPEQLDESLITANPKTDIVLRFDDFKLPGRNKGGRTGIRRNANGKVSTCSAYPADEKTQAILAESFARSVKTDKSLEAWQRQDLNTVVDNEQLEFFTVQGLKTFIEKNKPAPVLSFIAADHHPSMLRMSQCVSYLVGVYPFVIYDEILLKQLQTIVEHAQKMVINCPASSPGSASSLLAIRLKLATFMETEINPTLRAYKEYDELGLHDMEVSGTSARWKRLKCGHKIRKLVRHIRTLANSAQDRRNKLLAEFADLMIAYNKQVRESKGLHVDEDACLRVRSVFNQAS